MAKAMKIAGAKQSMLAWLNGYCIFPFPVLLAKSSEGLCSLGHAPVTPSAVSVHVSRGKVDLSRHAQEQVQGEPS